MTSPHLFEFVIGRVRLYIRDTKELNKLLGNKFESDDTSVRMAIIDAINDWNISQPPLPAIDLRSHPSKLLLIKKASLELIKSAMIWHSREHMPSQDGGTSADDHAKFGEYSQWISMIEADYERKKSELKVSQNLAACFGGIASEYSYGWEDWGYNFRSVDTGSGDPGGVGINQNVSSDPIGGGDAFFDPMEEPQPPSVVVISPPSVPGKNGDTLMFILSSTNAPSKKLFTIPAGATVYEVRIQVQTIFSGSSGTPGITVGDSLTTDLLALEIESDLTELGTYVINIDSTFIVATDIYAYLTNVPVVGQCKVIITYDLAEP